MTTSSFFLQLFHSQGIPESVLANQQPTQTATAPLSQFNQQDIADAFGGFDDLDNMEEADVTDDNDDGNDLNASRTQAVELRRLLQLIQQHPEAMQEVVQALAQERPDLLNLILQNQGQITQMLGNPAVLQGAVGDARGVTTIQLNPEERESIDRVRARLSS
jgi:alpha-galactosidase/6-phospho-beta-glucosidase family protein